MFEIVFLYQWQDSLVHAEALASFPKPQRLEDSDTQTSHENKRKIFNLNQLPN
jgi:hypothetical protein